MQLYEPRRHSAGAAAARIAPISDVALAGVYAIVIVLLIVLLIGLLVPSADTDLQGNSPSRRLLSVTA